MLFQLHSLGSFSLKVQSWTRLLACLSAEKQPYLPEEKEGNLLATGLAWSREGSAAVIAGGVNSSEIDKLPVGESVVGATLALQVDGSKYG